MSNPKSEDIFGNLSKGLTEFGKKVGSFVDDVLSGEGVNSDFRVRHDMYQSGDQFVLALEIPGMSKQEISIQIHEGVLQIKGDKKKPEGSDSFQYVKQDRQFGPFLKSFELPGDIEFENVKASYEAGVLTIRFQRPQPAPTQDEDQGSSVNID